LLLWICYTPMFLLEVWLTLHHIS